MYACRRCGEELGDGRRRLCPSCLETHRWCNRCSTVKRAEAFYGFPEKPTRYCKACHMAHIRRPDRIEAQREYHYRYHLQRKHGITPEEADRLARVEACECCGAPRGEERLHVEHCHGTGKIRGVVCRRCNYAIAVLEENGLVEAVTAYLARS